ncbi:Putative clathrin assembly protein [Auxenochlorella protothecoides]|uniref:Putative clathrin assembly protein n=1 Tax=Auxenochlorella protothecoides TaxID=3075 RepID=A0A087SC73_AUXPR|nr:Putative clathrin assembly protein [Auxenochlorella protothecoides]KFM23327.1 Putative clathrin assembly protein [Auxenochlorella protothecoides]
MTELTTAQSLKQSVRQFGLRASDTWKLAGAKTSRSDTKLLDVALVKATTPQTRVPPKEKHVRTLKLAVSGGGGSGSASYVVSHLLQRLHNASDWLTALKSLITIHRLMAETDEGGRFDFSEFVRAYGKYLDEQLRLYAAAALDAVVRESFQLYKALSEGVINLADAYFSMPYLQAVKGLEIYREASAGTDALSAFYAAVGQLGGVGAARSLPSLTPPPADFVASMEEYLAEAPRPEGEAALPKVRSGPLRKGRLAHSASGRAGEGGAASHPRTLSSDPGMVLAPSQEPAGGEEGPDGGSGGGLASPGGAPGSPGASTGPPRERDLLGSAPGTPARTPAHAAPSPLDLLGGLTLEGLDVAPPAAPGGAQAPPHASANPFAGPDPFAAYGAEPAHGQPTRGADPFALPGAQHAFGFGAQGNGAPTSSPAVLSPGGTARWTQGAAGTPQGGGEDLVRAAGARDPFATLAALSPGSSGRMPSPGGGLL